MPTKLQHPPAYPHAALLSLGRALQEHGYGFTTVTPLTQQRVNARAESAQAHDLAGIFGWSRPFSAEVAGAPLLALMRAAAVVAGDQGMLRAALRASTLDGQLYFHSAYPTTAADAVFFGPDTSRFVRALRGALAALEAAPLRAADIGCGAGPAAITIALAHPGAAVHALDINPAALQLTEVNAALAGAGNVRALHSDMLCAVDGLFDLIVSNPPYLLDRELRAYRHGGGALGAGMSLAVVEAAIARLAPGGKLMLYTGVAIVGNRDPFRAAAGALLQAARFNWSYEEIDPDVFGEELDEPAYAHADRIAAVWLCATAPATPA